jgi:GNAT superfamily N-acetyltransferase
MLQTTKVITAARAKIGLTAGQLGLINTSSFYVFRRDYSGTPPQIDSVSKLNIRLIVPEDIQKISQKLKVNFQENFSTGNGGMAATIGDDLVHWSLFACHRSYRKLIDGNIRLDSDSAYIFNMYTDPKHRGKEISARVLDAICSHLYRKGITKFYVFILTNNPSSIKSVSKAGFRKIGSVKYFRFLNFRFFKITGNTENKITLRKMLSVFAPTEICYVH